ncbi:MAG: epoxyqueuosine reductase [Spirochaetes bacterium]|nr:epoxyqueuosine reductase [Spirochaetota bacterium]
MPENFKEFILNTGADLIGFADLKAIPDESRSGLPSGIAIGIALNPEIVSRIPVEPTIEYVNEYNTVTSKLDAISIAVQNYINSLGHKAIAQTVEHVRKQQNQNSQTYAVIPHKTVAAIAGLGWIAKSSLLITETYGSAVRFTSILTDAPLETTATEYECLCGNCTVCIDSCPGNALKNRTWNANLDRDDLVDFEACSDAVHKRGEKLGETHGTCGICMAICPHTQKYLKS